MKNRDVNGSNIIELVIVIAIIATVLAVIIPKITSISNEVQLAATTSMAGALSAANASNYAIRRSNHNLGIAISNCTDVAKALLGTMPKGYEITPNSVSSDKSIVCTLHGPESTNEIFTATGIN